MLNRHLLLSCISLVCFTLSLFAWVLTSPVGASPDEDFHQTMLYCATGDLSGCAPEGTRYGHCYTMRPTQSGDCKNYRDRPAPIATQIKSDTPLTLYYKIGQFLVSDSLGETTLKIRLMNALLATVSFFLALWLTTPAYRPALFLALTVCSLPLSAYFLASINPSAWAIVSMAALMGPLISLIEDLQRDGWRHITTYQRRLQLTRAGFVVIAAAIGLGTRYEAYLWTPIALSFALAMTLSHKQTRLSAGQLMAGGTIGVLAAAALIFVFAQRSPVNLDSLWGQVSTNITSAWVAEKSLNTLLGVMALTGIPGAELGTTDVPMPPMVSFFVALAVGGTVLKALSEMDWRHTLIGLGLLSTIILIILVLWSTTDWDYYQPRYFLPIFYFFVFTMLLGLPKTQPIFERRYWALILSCTVITYTVALLTTLLRFLHGLQFQQTRYPLGKEAIVINPNTLRLTPRPEWWLIETTWLNPFIVWCLGSLCFLIGVSIAWHLLFNKTVQSAAEA